MFPPELHPLTVETTKCAVVALTPPAAARGLYHEDRGGAAMRKGPREHSKEIIKRGRGQTIKIHKGAVAGLRRLNLISNSIQNPWWYSLGLRGQIFTKLREAIVSFSSA